ncbi:hypothetical protein [Aliikangiella coralliicola]|uniref:Uncharacterized protein n=1 Tax=Aliikangiella coralliicola TaxID=2592383 RepID=A0A545U026_9GAMM|nr:hypothetical protein [Aliikangiella coralliicola]TQV82816.1 hypothetical protein FLL46_23905 [Aliikangiella coralliicola]
MREPDQVIGGDYLKRWYVIPRNRFFNIYLHCFNRSDDDRALHDHPWWSLSILLKGELIEHTFNSVRHIPRLLPIIRSAKLAHRLELVKGPAWTIFITGPKVREWGFHCPISGWRHWKKFTTEDGLGIERGCD